MATTASASLERELTALLGAMRSLPGNTRAYLSDATESRNLRGKADAIALPRTPKRWPGPSPGATTTTSRSSPAGAARDSPAAPFRSTVASF